MAKKIAAYTALFGRYEPLYDSLGHLDETYRFSGEDGVDRFYFTDMDMTNKRISYPIIKKNLDDLPPVKRQRMIKITIPDEIFDNYEYSIWVDSRPKLAVDPHFFMSHLKDETDALFLSHGTRDCVYEEGRTCIEHRRDARDVILRQLDYYKTQGYPARNGLYATNLLARKHTKKTRRLMDSWWNQVETFSCRDQISLPYVLWKCDFDVSVYPDKLRKDLFLDGLYLMPNQERTVQWSQ
jgi:hypothetical protein